MIYSPILTTYITQIWSLEKLTIRGSAISKEDMYSIREKFGHKRPPHDFKIRYREKDWNPEFHNYAAH